MHQRFEMTFRLGRTGTGILRRYLGRHPHPRSNLFRAQQVFILRLPNYTPHPPGKPLEVGLSHVCLTRYKPCHFPANGGGGCVDPYVEGRPDLDDVPRMTAAAVGVE